MPDTPTLCDYLLLSLRNKDYIATFNWDPFLAKAFMRNRGTASLPRILFLHGNVQIGVCTTLRQKGFIEDKCDHCEALAMATLQVRPFRENRFPQLRSLSQLHNWIAPLVVEEKAGRFGGMPCLHAEDFSSAPASEKKKIIAMDWVLGCLAREDHSCVPPFRKNE